MSGQADGLSESIVSIPRHVLDLRYQLSLQGMLLGPRYELWKSPDNLGHAQARCQSFRPHEWHRKEMR